MWKDSTSLIIDIFCPSMVVACLIITVCSLLLPQYVAIQGLDSDYLHLEMRPTTLPFDGVGVFAKVAIPAFTLLCEYSGVIVPQDYKGEDYNRARAFHTVDLTGTTHAIIGDTICAEINDCARINNHPFTARDINYFSKRRNMILPSIPGFANNAQGVTTSGKVWVVSLRDIEAGEEILYSYRVGYWLETLASNITAVEPKNARFPATDTDYDMTSVEDMFDTAGKGSVTLHF